MQKLPAGQTTQCVAPLVTGSAPEVFAVAGKYPVGHVMQTRLPGAGWYVPISQGIDALTSQRRPAGHGTQAPPEE